MGNTDLSPLDDLNEKALFKLLGDAWYAQFKAEKGQAYYLPASADVGKREFDSVSRILRDALSQPSANGLTVRITKALRRETTWDMPIMVVGALARRQGMLTTIRS